MEKTHFKDKEKINVYSKIQYPDYEGESNCWEIAELLANEIRSKGGPKKISKEALKEILVNKGVEFKEKPQKTTHDFAHEKCDNSRIQNDSCDITEKRICRCMNYYGRDKGRCKDCRLKRKYNNIGQYKVIDYEVPCSSVLPGIGGIDLILENGSKQYAVEVKPPNSNESLVRMIAEILTYTLDIPSEYENALPAIAFFEKTAPTKESGKKVTDSVQLRHFKNCTDNETYKTLFSMVKVFLIRVKEKADNVWDYEFIEQPEGMK